MNWWKINKFGIISTELLELSAVISMFCGTVITGLFELGVFHPHLEVSKFNFWSLMFDVVFLRVLSFLQNLEKISRASNTWTKQYFESEFLMLKFFYWTSPLVRQVVLTKNILVNFVNLEHSVDSMMIRMVRNGYLPRRCSGTL